VAATAGACNGCASPQPTGIGVVAGAPVVVFADPATNSVVSSTYRDLAWTEAPVASKVAGLGLSFTAAGDAAYAAYYTGEGTIELAAWKESAWSTTKVADAADPEASAIGNLAPQTAVTVDGAGTIYVAWSDGGIHLASGTSTFAAVDIGHTVTTGVGPSLASLDAGVALSWYETEQQDQMIGFLGDLQDVLVAQPSPSLTIAQSTGGGTDCGADGTLLLDEVAEGTAFTESCLVAPAGEPFTITFDNQDAGLPHNVAIYTDSAATDVLFQGETFPGVATQDYDVDALDAGSYFFRCDVHPVMTGTLAAVKGAK
jgi:plastocyanin